ncbi:MAG: aminotransferase class V-fold PLP-dependent enzyme [Magnetococcales bacterium]|nr:aminotransferase class V-fold PLP-dependent enzyme [Magnetococcales bacterium]
MTPTTNAAEEPFWLLDPAVTFLNHGSFGACPRPVMAVQEALRREMEANPVLFFGDGLAPRLDDALACLAEFLAADEGNLLFMSNATTAVNTVFHSLRLPAGGEILLTNHVYPAVRHTVMAAAEAVGLSVVEARIPFPLRDAGEAVQAILAATTPRTAMAVLDHVTSPTALILPLERLLPALRAQGILTLVDGAHAPGMIPLRLEELGADFYAGNLHKWVCAPKGAGFLWIDPRHHGTMRPLVESNRNIRSRRCDTELRRRFFWTGTRDLSSWLTVPAALRILQERYGPWPGIMAANRALALEGRDRLAAALGIEAAAPDELTGAMVSLPLPPPWRWPEEGESLFLPLQRRLQSKFAITVPIIPWPDPDHPLLRISAHRHNQASDYHRLAEALLAL